MVDHRPWSYEKAVTRGFFHGEHPEPRALLGRRDIASVVGLAVILGVAAALGSPMPPVVRIAWSVAFLVASLGVLLAWLRSFSVLLERAHRGTLERPGLGEVRSWARFLAALLVYPAITLAALISIAWLGPLVR